MNLPQINPRERLALAVGALFVLAALIWFGLVAPYQRAMSRLDARIASRQQQLGQIQTVRQDYLQLQQQLAAAEARLDRGQDFSLFTFIETTAAREAGRENLVYMRPQAAASQEGFREEAVEIKLEKIRLDQLVRFLHAVEGADAALQIKNLRVRSRFDNRAQLDAVLTVSKYGRGT